MEDTLFMNFFRVLRKPTIMLLWSGQVISAFGDQLFAVALLWLSTEQLGSAAGLLFGSATFLVLLFGLFGGVIADRGDLRKLLIGIDIAQCALVGLLTILIWLHGIQVWYLIGVVLLGELLATIFGPALQLSIPLLADDEKTLYESNGLMDTTSRFARVVGPGLTGILLVFLPIFHFFTLDAASFAVSACTFLLVGSRLTANRTRSISGNKRERKRLFMSLLYDLMTAFTLARKHTAFFWSICSLGMINLAWSIAYTIGLPLWTQRVVHGSPAILGTLASVYGLGNVASLFLGTIGKRWPLTSMYAGKILQGAGFVMLASTSSPFVAAGSMFLSAVGGSLGDLTLATMIQTEFPSEHVGKIYSLRRTIGNLGLTVGMLVASLIYVLFNISTGILLSGSFIVIVGMICLYRFLFL
jgi:DHA3 family macrolide efflux protein-like MFS transporter